tara:strand:- start:27023 stop:28978 length:1956 start_codon:yes stop_codon:yes gene_type:complete
MPTFRQIKDALIKADAAGDMESARKLAPLVAKYREGDSGIPGWEDNEIVELRVQPPETSIGDEIIGAGETALTLGTGATGGALGMMGGTLKGIAEEMLAGNFGTAEAAKRIEQQAMEGAQAFTYSPRTQAGQEQVQAVGEVAQHLPPIIPAATELSMAGQTIRQAAPVIARAKVVPAAQQAAAQAKQGVSQVTERLRQVAPGTGRDAKDGGSVGAMAIDTGTRRQMLSDELPVPIKLTEGQRTRDFGDQRFERETAKMSEEGGPLRERFEEQNFQLQLNVDAFIDSTGSKIFDNRGVGELVDSVLIARKAKDKTKVRVLYKKARDSEESNNLAPPDRKVTIDEGGENEFVGSPVDYMNSRPSKTETSKAVDDARSNGVNLGILVKNEDGSHSAKPDVTVGQMEDWRREISQSLSKVASDTEMRDVTILKKLIDGVTVPEAGPVYKRARVARAKMARDYQDSHLMKSLLGTKAGTADRTVALEDVVRKVILNPSTSLDQMRHARKLLQTKTGGVKGEGAQAWRELQGATLRHIQDQMTKNVARNQAGDPIVSASNLDKVITNLDKSGKLDYIFGPDGADQLRVINDVAKDVLTAPPGAVNASNTATVLAGLMDVAISGSSGVPVPLMTSFNIMMKSVKDKKLKARIKKALGE